MVEQLFSFRTTPWRAAYFCCGLLACLLIPPLATAQNFALDFATSTEDSVAVLGYDGITGNGARTVEAWINVPAGAVTVEEAIIAEWGANNNSERWTVRVDDATGLLRIEIEGSFVLASSVPLNDGTWHHIAVVYDPTAGGSNTFLYVDGTLVGSGSLTPNTATGTDVHLGFSPNFSSPRRAFTGQIDEFRIWSSARSASQIAANGSCSFGGILPADLEVYYQFDAGQIDTVAGAIPDTVRDQTTYGRDGVLSSVPAPGLFTGSILSDIEVLGGGVTIVNGDIIPQEADSTAYGTVAAATLGGSEVHTFTIDNTSGGVALTIDTIFVRKGIDYIGPDTLNFPFTLAAGSDTTFFVEFAPQFNGFVTDTVEIQSSDCTDSIYTFVVGGVGCDPVVNVTQATAYSTLNAAVTAANANDSIVFNCDVTDAGVVLNLPLKINGQHYTLNSTSTGPGIRLDAGAAGTTIRNLVLDGAGTFGIQFFPDADNVLIANSKVQNSGGSGFAIGCADNVTLLNDTVYDNGGNGISVTESNNLLIDGLESNGNAFSPSFSAAIGIFSTSDFCGNVTDGITLTGVVNIGEPVSVYQQSSSGTGIVNPGVITNVDINPTSGNLLPPTFLTALVTSTGGGVTTNSGFYATDKSQAYSFARFAILTSAADPDSVYAYRLSDDRRFVEGDSLMRIRAAVDFTAPGGYIFVEAATYPERVVLDQSVTLAGAGKTQTILDGSTLIGNGDGIEILNNVTDVTIQDLQVREYAGASGNTDAGIRANLSNNNLTIQRVAVDSCLGGSGIYANGPVDNVLIDECMVTNQSVAVARGIVIWNGFKTNITITDNMVMNNNCCGIELQDGTASGVTITGNTVRNNADNGLGLTSLTSGAGPNLIANNIVENNGRFGIEIKNPNGTGLTSGDGSIVVENNLVTFDSSASMNVRDHAGIAAFRRAFLSGQGYADIPNGAVIRNNTVRGYYQANPSATTSEGFGIVIEGANHTVTGNTIDSSEVAIQEQGGGHANSNYTPTTADSNDDGDQSDGASPNYFGRGNAPVACGNTISGNIFNDNDTTFRQVGAGVTSGGTIQNRSTLVTYCLLQSAIDAATPGDTLDIGPGFYASATVDKDIYFANTAVDTIGELVLDGTGATLTLSENIIVDSLAFVDGLIDTEGNTVIADTIVGGNDTSYLIGTLCATQTRQNATIVFPVGTDTVYAPVQLEPTASHTNDTFCVSVRPALTAGSFTGGLPFQAFAQLEWTIDESTPGGSEADLEVRFPTSVQQGPLNTDTRLGRYDGSMWVPNGATYAAAMGVASVEVSGVLNQFSPFAVFSISCPARNTFVGSDTLRSQTDVNNFTDMGCLYTRVTGNLVIEDDGSINDLSNLSLLDSIDETLQITELSTVTDLSSLAQLDVIGDDLILGGGVADGNNSLTEIDLPELEEVGDSVFIRNNTGVESVAMDRLKTIGGLLFVRQNGTAASGTGNFELDSLTTVGGYFSFLQNGSFDTLRFPALTAVQDTGFMLRTIDIRVNTGLEVVDFPALTDAELGDVRVSNNDDMTGLFFPLLTDLDSSLDIRGNLLLDTLSFGSLTTIGADFIIINNDALLDLNTFTPLDTIGDDLQVENNNVLAACCIITCDLGIGGDTIISNNAAGCNSYADAAAICQPAGTIAATEAVICGGESSAIVFTATNGTGPFSIVVEGMNYTVNSGDTVFVYTPTGVGDTIFNLTRIEDLAPGSGCAVDGSPDLDTAKVSVEEFPEVTLTVGGDASGTIDASNDTYATTLCTPADLSLTASSAAGTSALSNPLYVKILISDASNVLGLKVPATNVIDYQDVSSPGTALFDLMNIATPGTGPYTANLRIIPYYETNPGSPAINAGECSGDTLEFTVTFNPEANVGIDFTAPFNTPGVDTASAGSPYNLTICDSTTVSFVGATTTTATTGGTPFVEVTLDNPDGVTINGAPLSSGTYYDTTANFDGNWEFINSGSTPSTVSATVVPYFENTPGSPSTAGECTGDTVRFSITIDPSPQIAACPSTVTINTSIDGLGDCQGTYAFNHPNVSNFCDPNATQPTDLEFFINGVSQGLVTAGAAASQTFGIGTNNLRYVATDSAGNVDSCNFTVTVNDNEKPNFVCPSGPFNRNITGVGADTAYVVMGTEFDLSSASDNCTSDAALDTTYTYTGATTGSGTNSLAGDTLQAGTTTVSMTLTDSVGNARSCTFTVTVADNTPPQFVGCPLDTTVRNITDSCFARYFFDVPGVRPVDSTDLDTIVQIAGLPSGGAINVGDTVAYSFRAVDLAGNADTCSFEVVAADSQALMIVFCPLNDTISAASGDCDADYAWSDPLAQDNCSVSPVFETFPRASASQTVNFPVGTTEIKTVFEDEGGNLDSCVFTITVADTTAPYFVYAGTSDTFKCANTAPVGVADTLMFFNDPMVGCAALLDSSDVLALLDTADACGAEVTVGQAFPPSGTTSSFSVNDPATPYSMVLTLTDTSGNTGTCLVLFNVKDTVPPTIVPGILADTTIAADSCFYGFVMPDFSARIDTFFDDCTDDQANITFVQSPAAGDTIRGTGAQTVDTTVCFYATDSLGNVDSVCFLVSASDSTAPKLSCLDDTLFVRPGFCDTFLLDYTALVEVSDNFSPTPALVLTQFSIDTTAMPNPDTSASTIGSALGLTGATGVNNPRIYITATDTSGFTSSCTFDLVVRDTVPPVITQCANDTLIELDASCMAVMPDFTILATFGDNCFGNAQLTVTQMAVSRTTNTNVPKFTVISAPDTFDGKILVTAPDGQADSCSFRITVADTTAPIFTACAPNVSLTVATGCDTTLADYTASPMISVSDNCPGSVVLTQSPAAGTTIQTGVTTVQIIATDAFGNADSCSFTVTVDESTPPMITCPNDTVLAIQAVCTATAPDYTSSAIVSDNCGPTGLTVDQLAPYAPGTVLNINDSVDVFISLSVTDASNNADTCTFKVTLQDTAPPVIQNCPSNRTVTVFSRCDTIVTWPKVTATDNCGVILRQIPARNGAVTLPPSLGGDLFLVGTTSDTVFFVATDISGNTDSCSFTVTVVDGANPEALCVQDDTLYLDANGSATLSVAQIDSMSSDNCDFRLELDSTNFDCDDITNLGAFNVPITVTLTATDSSGNTDQCTSLITVLDTIQPTMVCRTDTIFYSLGANGKAFVDPMRIDSGSFDNCAIANFSTFPDTLTCSSGPTTITLQGQDSSGNNSGFSLCTAIAVAKDSLAPNLVCETDLTVVLNGSGFTTLTPGLVDKGSSDNCSSSLSFSLSQDTFRCADVGTPKTIQMTVSDDAGNTEFCNVDITVQDNGKPVANCVGSVTVTLNNGGFALLGADSLDNGSTDNCDLNFSISRDSFTCADLGASPILIEFYATDNFGNADTCAVSVNVTGAPTPVAPVVYTPDTTICGDSLVLRASAPEAGVTATWTGPTGITISALAGDSVVTVTNIDTAGTYTFYYTFSNTCDTLVDSVVVTKNATPMIDALVLVPVSTFGANDGIGIVLPTVSGVIEYAAYRWFDEGGTFLSNNDTIVNLAAGTYSVVAEEGGCISDTATVTLNEPLPTGYNFSAKAFLEGPYNSGAGLMDDDLRTNGSLPLTDPTTGAMMDPSLMTITGPNALVDWVLLELRDATGASVLDTRPALIQRDGDIIDTAGNAFVNFGTPANGSYHIVVTHRNHLDIMTDTPILLQPGVSSPIVLNFTDGTTGTFGGASAQKTVSTVRVMYGGDANGDELVSPVDLSVFLPDFFSTATGYRDTDLNMDNVVDAGDVPFYSSNQGTGSRVP